MSPELRRFLREIHRWGGLLLATFILFYCITGVLLNHRKRFGYFMERVKTEYRVPVTDTKRIREFIELYKAQIKRREDPTVIKIKNGRIIEFLYGSHGKTTYIIDPLKGRMEKIEKRPIEPWAWLKNLHKAFRTASIWIGITDAVSIAIVIVTISGLIIFRYRPIDYYLLFAGVLLFLIAAAIA
ncbi:MAG: hypothetical protein GXO97_04315 [Nitrospirae bacterium]|nr:hypothetical protein [Nitrospirota bacterium]